MVSIVNNAVNHSLHWLSNLEEFHRQVKHSPQRQPQISSQLFFSLSSTHLIITTQQVSVFIMKPQLVVLLGLQSTFHDTFHYSTVFFLKQFDIPLLQRVLQILWLFFPPIQVSYSFFPLLFPILISQLLLPTAQSCYRFLRLPVTLYHSPSSCISSCLLPQHPLLTDASGYLVVVAPGAVWLADCGRQLFGGEPVAAVAEVGHPCADGVIRSEHTSVHWRTRHTAWHSCRRQEDNCRHTCLCAAQDTYWRDLLRDIW